MKAIGSATPAQTLAALALFLFFAFSLSFGVTPPKVSFLARMDYAVGSNPQGIAVGDLRSDGNLDLVTVSDATTSGSVSVLLGNADGTFQPAVNYPVPANSIIVKLGDFNGDGKLDILVASRSASAPSGIVSVSVLLGNGDGTFQAQKVTTIATSNCLCLAVGNFHGDGTLDIALPVSVPQIGDSALAVMRGNGDGTFQAPVVVNPGPFPTPLYPPSETGLFEAADFNNDGIPDLIYLYSGSSSSTILVFLGKGDGTFQPPKNTNSSCSVVADFTGDGKLDCAFVALNPSTNEYSVSVLPGNGDGTFGAPIVTSSQSSVGTPFFAADVNGDGKQDLVSAGYVLLGNGDGTFQTPVISSSGVVPGVELVFGDFNKDGKLDFATVSTIQNSNTFYGVVSVVFGNGDGTFQSDRLVKTGQGGYVVSVLADDFTGHGNTDLLEIVGFNTVDPVFVVLPGNGNGTFQAPTTKVQIDSCAFDDTAPPACSAVAGDFRGDGKFDVAITGVNPFLGLGTKVGVFLGNGDGTFQSEVDYRGGGSSIVLGDVNNDAIPDIITAGDGTDNVYLMLGKGDGTFGFTTTVTINEPANAVAVADFNKDGNLDLAVATPSGVAILLGNGKGAFGPETDFPIPGGATMLAAGDFNGDGNIDLVAGNSSSNMVSVLLNTGAGSFSAPATYLVVNNALYLTVADFNGDGIPDAAVLGSSFTSGSTMDVSILVGNGDGTFQPTLGFGASVGTVIQFAIADLNGDGSPDIAVGNSLLFNKLGTKMTLGLTSSNPSATVAAGKTASYTLSIGGSAFGGTVTLTCSGAPTAAQCTVPANVNVNPDTPVTFTVTVTTTAPATAAARPPSAFPHSGWLWTLALVGIALLPSSGRGRTALLLRGLPILLLLLFICSCGGSSNSCGTCSSGTPPGTYTVTVTATSGSMSQSLPLTLVVQ